MDYPRVSKGLKLVLFGELLELLSIIASIFLLKSLGNVAGILAVTGTTVISLIISLVGLKMAAEDNTNFSNALQITLGILIANILVAVFKQLGIFTDSAFSGTIIQIFQVLTAILILNGVCDILIERNMPTKFVTVTKCIYSVTQLFFIAFGIVSSSLLEQAKTNKSILVIVGILIILAVILLLLGYIFYLICLGKGSKAARALLED